MKKIFLFSVVGILTLLVGCGGGGGGDDVVNEGPATDIVGLQFTGDNMAEAALTGLDLLMLFPELSRIIAVIIVTIETDGDFGQGNEPLDEALCQEHDGTAHLTWFELEDRGIVALDLDSCTITNNPITGDLTLSDTIYDDGVGGGQSLTAQMTIDLTVTGSQNGGTSTLNIRGNFLLRQFSGSTNDATTLYFLYGGRNVDPGALLILSEGSDQINFGCFFVSVSFEPDGNEGTFMLGDHSHSIEPTSVSGVVVANRNLFEISGSPPAGKLADFVFVNFAPVSGNGIDYWGFIRDGGCSAVGAPHGVGQAGTANMALYPHDTGLALDLYSSGFSQGDPDQTLFIDWTPSID